MTCKVIWNNLGCHRFESQPYLAQYPLASCAWLVRYLFNSKPGRRGKLIVESETILGCVDTAASFSKRVRGKGGIEGAYQSS